MEALPARLLLPLGLRYSVSRAGALAQLTLEANVDSVAYVFQRVAGNEWLPVTPGGLSLRAHAPATVPEFAAGEDASVVLSRRPLPELAQSGPAAVGYSREAARRFQLGPSGHQVMDGSTYVVTPLPRPAEVIVVGVPTR